MINSLHLMANLYPFPRNLGKSATRSMSFLFILKEIEDGLDILLELQKLTERKLKDTPLSDEMSEIIRYLDKFYFLSDESFLIQKNGVLNLLCFYSEILLQASTVANETPLLLLEEMKIYILQFRSNLVAWKRTLAHHSLYRLTTCLKTYEELIAKMRQFFISLIPNFHESSTDENVLMYLVEKRDKLNFYLGEGFVENLLKSFFPTGLSRLKAAVCEGYVRRGFGTFYAEKEPLLDTLEEQLEKLANSCMIAQSH